MKTRLLKKLRKEGERVVRLHQEYDEKGYSYRVCHKSYMNDRCEYIVYKNKNEALDALHKWRSLYILQCVYEKRNKILDL